MRSLAQAIGNDFDFKRLIVVVGIMEDKDIKHILAEIVPLGHRVIYTRPAYYRAANPQHVMDVAKKSRKDGRSTFLSQQLLRGPGIWLIKRIGY